MTTALILVVCASIGALCSPWHIEAVGAVIGAMVGAGLVVLFG
jgi:hypothetical protein